MSNPYGLKVGQELWYVSGRSSVQNHLVAIKSIGRQWAKLDWYSETRLNLETLKGNIPGFGDSGRFYLSKEEWESECALNAAWSKFQSDIRLVYRRPPKSVTIAAIEESRRLLGIVSND